MTLSDKTVKNAKASERYYRLWDAKGLYLEVSSSGSKLWRFKYRFNSKEKLLAFGSYPYVSLKDARDKAFEARNQLSNGIDPGAERRSRKEKVKAASKNSFEIVAREWIEKQSGKWAPGYTKTITQRLEYNVFKIIGPTAIEQLTPPILLSVLRLIEERGTLETAHRVLTCMGQIFRYAIATGRLASDPARDLRGALPPTTAKHLASITDPKKVGALLKKLHGYPGSEVVRHALQLAPLVFVRPGELRHAEWSQIDFDAAEWRYTVTKTKQGHIVPLSRQAAKILQAVQLTTGRGRYVFPSPRTGSRPMSNNAVLAALRSLGIEKNEMCGHGFRAMARTLLDEVLKFSPHLIEHQLAHGVKDPLGRAYNRTTHLEERRAMMQKWADYLDGLRTKQD